MAGDHDEDPLGFFDSIMSLAVLFMWIRQLRLLSLMSSTMSDLVQMLAIMLTDVLKVMGPINQLINYHPRLHLLLTYYQSLIPQFMALFSVVLFGFASSLAHLISHEDVAIAAPECSVMMSRLDNAMTSAALLFEGALLGASGVRACPSSFGSVPRGRAPRCA